MKKEIKQELEANVKEKEESIVHTAKSDRFLSKLERTTSAKDDLNKLRDKETVKKQYIKLHLR